MPRGVLLGKRLPLAEVETLRDREGLTVTDRVTAALPLARAVAVPQREGGELAEVDTVLVVEEECEELPEKLPLLEEDSQAERDGVALGEGAVERDTVAEAERHAVAVWQPEAVAQREGESVPLEQKESLEEPLALGDPEPIEDTEALPVAAPLREVLAVVERLRVAQPVPVPL